MEDPVPAIAEAEARGETAALFADIRGVLRVGVVNLIWRHLATIDGALPWAWSTLRPAYAADAMALPAVQLAADAQALAPPPWPPEVLACAGLDQAGITAVRGVLDAYARTNPLALIAFSALAARVEDAPEGLATAPASTVAPHAPPAMSSALPLPPLPPAASLTPDIAALVWRLNGLGALRSDAVLATMYRHLAHWPAALALGWTILAPRAADGSLGGMIAACRIAARAAASRVVLADAPPLPAGSRAAVAEALDRFAGEVLPRMVVACAILRGGFAGR